MESVKFLGVHIDAGLTWRAHGDALARRLCSASFALRRLSESVSIDALRTTYFSLFESHLLYGLLTWGHSAIMTRIFGIQRRAIRVLDGRGYREDCRVSFVRLGVLTLPSLYILQCLKYIASNKDLFEVQGDIHEYRTRRREDIRSGRLRLTRSRNGVNYFGVLLYNTIEPELRNLPEKQFINYIKQYMIRNPYYSLQEFLTNPPRLVAVESA